MRWRTVLVGPWAHSVAALGLLLAGAAPVANTAGKVAAGAPVTPYAIVGDTIPASLTGATGDPVRGRAIVGDRRVGLCLLCHTGPFPAPSRRRKRGDNDADHSRGFVG